MHIVHVHTSAVWVVSPRAIILPFRIDGVWSLKILGLCQGARARYYSPRDPRGRGLGSRFRKSGDRWHPLQTSWLICFSFLQWAATRFTRIDAGIETEKTVRDLHIQLEASKREAEIANSKAEHAKQLLDLFSHADYDLYRASLAQPLSE